MKMTTTSLQVFSLNKQQEKLMSKCSSLIRIFTEQHRGLPGSLPRCVSFAGSSHPHLHSNFPPDPDFQLDANPDSDSVLVPLPVPVTDPSLDPNPPTLYCRSMTW